MCGIVAYSGKKNYNTDKIKYLLYSNSIERKSTDATGFWTPINGLNKTISRASVFIGSSEFRDLIEDNLLISHVRAKTSGGSTVADAHPYVINNILGVHNGTVTNTGELVTRRGLESKNNTDSKEIYMCLAHDCNPSVFSEIDGPGAFVFTDLKSIDQHHNILYVTRNTERTLFYAIIDEGMYISSERSSLVEIGAKHTDITIFEAGKLFTIHEGKIIDEVPVIPIKNNPDKISDGFTDRWILAKESSPSLGIDRGKWYYSEKRAIKNYAGTLDDDLLITEGEGIKQAILAPRKLFNIAKHYSMKVGENVVSMATVQDTVDNKRQDVAQVGDLCHILDIQGELIEVVNLNNNITYIGRSDFFRVADGEEVTRGKNLTSLKSDTIALAKSKVWSKDFDVRPNVKTNVLNQINEMEEELKSSVVDPKSLSAKLKTLTKLMS